MTEINIDAIRQKWQAECGPCDYGLRMGCACPSGDPRVPISALLAKVAELTAELERVRQDRDTKADIAKNRADTITTLSEAIDELTAANARLREQRDEQATKVNAIDSLLTVTDGDPLGDRGIAIPLAEIRRVVGQAREGAGPEYLIWSQHHQSWWGPGRSGYRRDPADAGRYTLAAAKAEMTRGCHCCQVPEVPVFAAKVIGKGDQAVRDAITQATDWTIKSGQANKAYEPSICRACDKPGYHPETCPTVPAELPEATR